MSFTRIPALTDLITLSIINSIQPEIKEVAGVLCKTDNKGIGFQNGTTERLVWSQSVNPDYRKKTPSMVMKFPERHPSSMNIYSTIVVVLMFMLWLRSYEVSTVQAR